MSSFARSSAQLPKAVPNPPLAADRCRQMAIQLQKQGRLDHAIGFYRHALALNPSDASALRCLGTAYKTQGRVDLAEGCFRRAVELSPTFPEAWNNLGNTLSNRGELEEAAECYRRAFTVQPDFAGAHFNFAQVMGKLGEFDQAIVASRRAVELAPRSAEFYNGLGMALYDALRVEEAIAAYEQALRLRPDFPSARYNRSHAWLLLGDFSKGWAEYEWRLKLSAKAVLPSAQPRWDGSIQPHATVLLDAEQGLGDTIQFVRYLPIVKDRVGRVILRCQKPLVQLLKSLPNVDRLVSKDEPVSDFDLWSPLMSLPLIFSPDIDSIPRAIPYLVPDETIGRYWKSKLAALDGLRVGINWQGNPAFPKDRSRSIPLRCFEPLAKIPGVKLISLQRGAGTEQLSASGSKLPVIDLGLKLDEIHGPFLDTAAILTLLDLFVTSDTALAHLAGALGVPTWLAVPAVPEWRWLLRREDSPWYPTLRLFRQARAGQWEDVFKSMASALVRQVSIPRPKLLRHPQSLPALP